MAPPPYPDLGKQARDIFSQGYHFGLIKLNCKTQTAAGVEFTTGGQSNQDAGTVEGSLETKYKVKEYGLTFTEKWSTKNTLSTEVAIQDQLVKGLRLSTLLSFAPQSGEKSGKVKAAFQNPNVALNADVDIDKEANALVGLSAVVGYQGWLAGYQTCFDKQQNKLSKNNFALGFSTSDFILHTNVNISNDGQEFGGSLYQKLSPQLQAGVNLAWTAGGENTRFGIGARYELDCNASIRCKVNNTGQIGLGYQQLLREGVTLTLSTLVEGKNINEGGHKVGIALDLEA